MPWYRMRMRVDSPQGVKLALAGPSDVDDIYQSLTTGPHRRVRRFLGQNAVDLHDAA